MPPHGPRTPDEALKRAEFVLYLRQKGLRDLNILRAVEGVARTPFVPDSLSELAYADRALPIACGQSTTPLHLVAYIIEQLKLNDRHKVLEVGTGSGYLTAILSRLARRVYTIDRYRTLVAQAEVRLAELKVANVTAMVGDGTVGWPAQAPFDRIVLTASAEQVPGHLVGQLRDDGILIMPIGKAGESQQLVRVDKNPHGFTETPLMAVRFLPLASGRAISM
jgi:protein-L-isoaspartate(D-aspartate) O-methyltransferase